MDDMDEVVQEFLVESHENLDRLDREFVELEEDPTSRPLLASIFRTIHTIKGTAGFLGFDTLQGVAHAGESLLSLLRDGERELTEARTSALLRMVDAVRAMLAAIEETGRDGDDAHAELIAELDAQCHDGGARHTLDRAGPSLPVAEVVEAAVTDAAAEANTPDAGRTGPAETTIRVDVGLLDRLVNLVGELVLARNQILQFAGRHDDAALTAGAQQLDLITTELQEGVMKTRMQPIGTVWSKFPRVVRDLAVTCGKRVRIEMEGADTELDRTILEAVKDPLTHLVRNAVDHGIERPEERLEAGKPAEGTLRLRAYHDGGQVVIEIADDGGGVDCERVRAKAVDRGIVTAAQAARMTEREVAHLVFEPGFSTAEQISSISGRGVGMDVVRTNVEKIGGTVDVHSVAGRGMTLTVKIPLTLAIIPALVVAAGGCRYAIPQVNLVELLRIERDGAGRGVEHVGDAPVFRLRGRLLPLVWLRDVLGLGPDGLDDGAHNVVVIQADDRRFGLVVDRISDTEEIVVKPLGIHLKGIGAFAGATIMGDGSVALILDVLGIARQASLVGEEPRPAAARSAPAPETAGTGPEAGTVLVCLAGGQRIAIPLALVSRLEEFPRNQLERAAGREVVQYRGGVLPLVSLAGFLGHDVDHGYRDGHERPLQVLVHDDAGRSVGLVVDEIVDVMDLDLAAVEPSDRPGVPFSAVIGRRVTDLVDVDALVRSARDGQLARHGS